jgi:AAA15 family ATPase/GTPase
MKIKNLNIKNYRIFENFTLDNLAIPDNKNEGSGLNIILGENGLGKTSILDAIALGLNTYKTEYFSWHDLKKEDKKVCIILNANDKFNVKGLYPNSSFNANALKFIGYLRKQSISSNNKIIVKDNLYISSEKKWKPDLRASLTNIYGGSRHKQSCDILDANYRSGSFIKGKNNKSSFDYFLEDLNYRYIKEVKNKNDLNDVFKEELKNINISNVISKAINDFNKITGFDLNINLIENNFQIHF